MNAEHTAAEQPRQQMPLREQKVLAGFFLSIVGAFLIGAIVGWFYREDWMTPVQGAGGGGVGGVLILCGCYFLVGVAWAVVLCVEVLLK